MPLLQATQPRWERTAWAEGMPSKSPSSRTPAGAPGWRICANKPAPLIGMLHKHSVYCAVYQLRREGAKHPRGCAERAAPRLGATAEKAINVRILSATHKNLSAEVAAGRFRQGLFYRLPRCANDWRTWG